MVTTAYYSDSAFRIFSGLPQAQQIQIESVRQTGLIKLFDIGRAHVFDNTCFPVLYKDSLPKLGVTLKYYFRTADDVAVIIDIKLLPAKP